MDQEAFRASRYHRQMLFGPLGEAGQKRLGEARVGVVGCGALGSVAANLLVRAGVGCVRLADRDYLQLNNLHRQMLFTEEDVARRAPKAAAAAGHLRAINSDVVVEPRVIDINPFTLPAFAAGLDLLVDGTDNFATRFLLNDLAVREGLPWVYGGVIGASGMVLAVVPGRGPCLRCLFRELPAPGAVPTCDTAGVLGTAVSVVASLEVNEALKLLVDPAARTEGLVTLDLWDLHLQVLPVERDPECPACGARSFPFLDAEAEDLVTSLCGHEAVQVVPAIARAVDLRQLEQRLRPVGPTRLTPFLLEVEVEGAHISVFPDGRAILEGVQDPAAARGLYARYVGQ